jgi:hypothetical protein
MSNANLPEEPYENPFEAPRTYGFGENDGGSDPFGNQGSDDDSHQMPPVEQSYWTGFLLFGLLSLANCVVSSLRVPVSSPVFGPSGLASLQYFQSDRSSNVPRGTALWIRIPDQIPDALDCKPLWGRTDVFWNMHRIFDSV